MKREDRLDVKRDLIPLLVVSLVAVVMYNWFMLAQPYSGDPLGYRYAARLLARGEPLEFCDDNNARFGKYFTLPFFNYVNSENVLDMECILACRCFWRQQNGWEEKGRASGLSLPLVGRLLSLFGCWVGDWATGL